MDSVILSEGLAGLQSQAFGLTEAAGLQARLVTLVPRTPWRFVAARVWPAPLAAVGLAVPPEPLVVTCGGTGGAVGAALRKAGRRVVQVQNPRMDLRRFDLVVANRHDRITGPNVIVTRTALHRATAARLAAARAVWAPVFAHLPRPLVAVLVGGSNGRFRLEAAEGAALAGQLAAMMRADRVGLAVTPSRRTAPAVTAALRVALEPLGAWVWDGAGDNPYFGMLALADAIVATEDSVSMVSEAVATSAPVLLARLPGGSQRIGLFTAGLLDDGRVRPFTGRLEMWQTNPLDDTQAAADEMRHRLGF
jgi:mitochondrial fission protein ELM1